MALVSVQTPSRLQLVAEANATFLIFGAVNIAAYYGPATEPTMNPALSEPRQPPRRAKTLAWPGGSGPQGASAGGGDLGSQSDETADEPVAELLRADVPSLEYWLDVNG
jgi:hypothetical protein